MAVQDICFRHRIETKIKGMGKRIGIYLAGMIFVSLGIVLCAKCGLGVSPISSLPYVFEAIVPVTFGQLTMIFHLINIGLQLLLVKKIWNIRVLLQIPVAVLFGQLIDLLKNMIRIDQTNLLLQYLALILSIFFTALGMVCMIEMDLVQNPPDGLVKLISEKCGAGLGRVKIMYDVTMAVLSGIIGMVFLGKLRGLGIATVVSAVLVGRCVSGMQRGISKRSMV